MHKTELIHLVDAVKKIKLNQWILRYNRIIIKALLNVRVWLVNAYAVLITKDIIKNITNI